MDTYMDMHRRIHKSKRFVYVLLRFGRKNTMNLQLELILFKFLSCLLFGVLSATDRLE